MASILVVDDAVFMREMIKDLLEGAGHEVVGEAENGLQAIEQYKALTPNLVMMDITMPELNGIQALKQIIEQDTAANVIMCSAMGQQALVLEAVQLGAKDFIVKPFQKERVLETVEQVLQSAQR